jgi:mRNA interferase MazF
VIVMAVTSNLELAQMPGNVALPRWASGLPDVSIANVTQVLTLDRKYLLQHVKMLPAELIDEIDFGLRTSLGLP